MRYIRLQTNENISINKKNDTYLSPNYAYLPCNIKKLIVKQNSKILKDENIMQDGNIKSPISGEVIGISKLIRNNKKENYVVIKNDFKEKRKPIKKKNISKLTINYLLDTIDTHKNKELLEIFRSIRTTDNIIIDTIDDETYSKNGIMLFKNNLNNILDLVNDLSIVYNSKINTIVISEKEKELIEDCLNTIGSYPNIKITLNPDLYLLGKKEFLLDYLNYDEKNTLFLRIEDAYLLYELLYNNEIPTYKYITISGDGIVGEGKVLMVKKYSRANEIINKYFKLKDNVSFWVNGLMSGYEAKLDDIIITDDVKVINIMERREKGSLKCFNCGKCVSICPRGINPIKCYKKKKKDNRCINCGLCNYICPAMIDLKKEVLGDK